MGSFPAIVKIPARRTYVRYLAPIADSRETTQNLPSQKNTLSPDN